MQTKKQMKVRELFNLLHKCIVSYEYSLDHLELKRNCVDYVDASYHSGKIEATKDFIIDLNVVFEQVKELYSLFDVKEM